ncbi:MAG: hypothetical protein NW241_03290 [Bacteroidia bacterium]|nr:hypothetical protein [Bacteroidia bacterium]
MSIRSRYPGAQPFSPGQSELFFGRKDETARLHRLVRLEPLAVLYARSGLGKSSLLNAGLIPALRLEGQYRAVPVRLGAWTEGKAETPLEIALQAIRQETGAAEPPLAGLAPPEGSLWEALKAAQAAGSPPLVLIFDQFEELFTYPAEAVQAFAASLAEALYTRIPQRYRSALERQLDEAPDRLDEALAQQLETPLDLRVLMAIRSDRLSLLDGLTGQLPTLLKHLFELPPLGEAAARQAIVEPARQREGDFASPPFAYAPEALDRLIAYLTRGGQQRIESTQLQILCQSVERKVRLDNQVMGPEDLGDPDAVTGGYYEEQLARLGDAAAQLPARRLIEEGLVFEEEERRLSMYEGQIYSSFGLNPAQLRTLVDAHLLRAEPSLQGGYTYELSHDTLVAPVLAAKRKRLHAEREAREAARRAEQEAALREAKAEAAQERRRRVYSNILAAAAVIGLLVALWQSWVARQAQAAAKQAQTEAEHNLQTAEANLQAFRIEKAAALLRDGDAFVQNGELGFALGKYREVLALMPDDTAAQGRIRRYAGRE